MALLLDGAFTQIAASAKGRKSKKSSAATRNRCGLQPLNRTPATLPPKNRTGMKNAG